MSRRTATPHSIVTPAHGSVPVLLTLQLIFSHLFTAPLPLNFWPTPLHFPLCSHALINTDKQKCSNKAIYLLVLMISLCAMRSSSVFGLYFSTLKHATNISVIGWSVTQSIDMRHYPILSSQFQAHFNCHKRYYAQQKQWQILKCSGVEGAARVWFRLWV